MAEIRHRRNRHDVIFSAEGGPIWIKFRRLVQNDMSCPALLYISYHFSSVELFLTLDVGIKLILFHAELNLSCFCMQNRYRTDPSSP